MTTRRCSSTTILTTWAAVVTSPTWTEKYRSILSMCPSVRCLSKNSLEYKKQLILAQSKEVDVTNFETKMEDFKQKFSRHYELYTRKFDDAIKDIDATISKLQKVRAELVSSENNLRLATQDTEDLTIRKLTYNNPTMKAKFDEARNTQAAVEIKDDEE